MRSSFLKTNGFFVCWEKNGDECWVRVQNETKARELFATLKSRIKAELFQLVDNQFKKLA